ncbi:hypothetical protein [Paraburkholderia sediminicola]|jgi:hypothetical protein|uniref:hypothetical protein n=1 Tax=Paraburkholderia sediminicola TaxID=458836 RepID=UPI0038BB78AE
MRKQIFVDNPTEFHDLWGRATAGLRLLQRAPQQEVVYFDSAIVTTRYFYQFVNDLFRFANVAADSFAYVGLRPDPVGYFFHHFSKFPAIIFQPTDSEADYCTMLQADPGGSPADALAFNTWAYVVLPSSGDWIAYGDDSKEIAVFSGAPEVNEFARATLARDIVRPAPDFKLID